MGSCIQKTSYIVISVTGKNQVTVKMRVSQFAAGHKSENVKKLSSQFWPWVTLAALFHPACCYSCWKFIRRFIQQSQSQTWLASSWDVHLLPRSAPHQNFFWEIGFLTKYSSIAVPVLITCAGKLVLSRTQGASCMEAQWWVFKCKILLEILFIARHLVSDDWQFCDQVEPAQVQSPGKSNLASKHCQPFISTL